MAFRTFIRNDPTLNLKNIYLPYTPTINFRQAIAGNLNFSSAKKGENSGKAKNKSPHSD